MTIALRTAPVATPVRPGSVDRRVLKLEADRMARIVELRDAILDGTYEVSTADVADSIIAAHA